MGVAGNQTAKAEEILRSLDLPIDILGTSASWGAEKPSRAFFEKLIGTAGCPAQEIVYVGDRLDNDVLPALEAGLLAVFLRRGPWGYIHAAEQTVERADLRISSPKTRRRSRWSTADRLESLRPTLDGERDRR